MIWQTDFSRLSDQMPDALTTITKFIQSPPGQLAAGGVLAGIVWKFFERVETVLTDDTKLEIAVWLLGVKVGEKVEPWSGTFAKVFDRVFGAKHLSWKCLTRSCLATLASCFLTSFLVYIYLRPRTLPNYPSTSHLEWGPLLANSSAAFVFVFFFAYLSLLETRFILKLLLRSSSWLIVLGLLVTDVVMTGLTGALPSYLANVGPTVHPVASYLHQLALDRQSDELAKAELEQTQAELQHENPPDLFHQQVVNRERRETEGEFRKLALDEKDLPNQALFRILIIWLPTFFTSIWLWLYAGSGFILKAARRFDIGFDWFNRHFDIEKHPLQSIGLVASALVAVVYWTVVVVSRVV
jgi:hypothetical protein